MPPDRGRASRACAGCRKQKTRCYESNDAAGVCLRCQRLELRCSLETAVPEVRTTNNEISRTENSVQEERLARLEWKVERLEARLEEPPTASKGPEQLSATAEVSTDTEPLQSSYGDSPTAGPVFVIRDVATEVGMGPAGHRTAPIIEVVTDIISKGLVTQDKAVSLLKLFHEHYGRWVSFNDVSADMLVIEVRKSPLLLCACCLIAVRHTSEDSAIELAQRLFLEAKTLFSQVLLVVPQNLAFFQAALVLSLWSTTIGQVLLSIDSWLSSGFALQHSLASGLFAPIHQGSLSHLDRSTLQRWFVWNHLCLVHLHYCVGTRRKALVDSVQIERCRRALDSDHATNFEYRMVAEVNLYWIIYESCLESTIDLPKAQTVLHSWKQEWKYLFATDQPRSQFLQMGFHFAQLLIFDQSLKSRSAAVRESLLSEMVRLSAAIINLAIDTADVRSRHLSDHIYHVITFAAVTLCRLLHMYEDQLSTTHNIPELDQLVLSLVAWLRSVGLPCHVANTLSNVVSAFHKKLRPDVRPTPSYEEVSVWEQADFVNWFPEMLGTEFYDGTGDALLPDWAPFMAQPPT